MSNIHYPPLSEVTSPVVNTAQAAHYLNRSAQTLRIWSSTGTGPIRPVNIAGRLAWSVDKIKEIAEKGAL